MMKVRGCFYLIGYNGNIISRHTKINCAYEMAQKVIKRNKSPMFKIVDRDGNILDEWK